MRVNKYSALRRFVPAVLLSGVLGVIGVDGAQAKSNPVPRISVKAKMDCQPGKTSTKNPIRKYPDNRASVVGYVPNKQVVCQIDDWTSPSGQQWAGIEFTRGNRTQRGWLPLLWLTADH
jgi:hypothetical protein